MALDKNDVRKLLDLVAQTREEELNCEECFARIAEFAERQLAGKPVDAGLAAVEQHLAVCGECRDFYEALRQSLMESGGE